MVFGKSWKHAVTGVDGKCTLFGVNIFDHKWEHTGETATVVDPLYRKKHSFSVFTVTINGEQERFAAGEFSNCVWGFYVEE